MDTNFPIHCVICGAELRRVSEPCPKCSPPEDQELEQAFAVEDWNSAVERVRLRFPDMEPLEQAPDLRASKLIGVIAIGRRDEDAITITYVTTLYLAILAVPTFALSAYRVAKASKRLMFFGKVPLNASESSWNLLIATVILAIFVLGKYVL